ncbi:MAG: DUF4912 domain-containing protein [Chitinophagales bacterium]
MSFNILLAIILVLLAIAVCILFLSSQSNRSRIAPSAKPFTTETSVEISPPNSQEMPTPELPWGYNDTRVVLMVRDPHYLYVYWEIGEDNWNHIRSNYGEENVEGRHVVLRLCELDKDANSTDINLGTLIGGWHIAVDKEDTPFYCLLGIKIGDNFVPIAVSNTVVTPRNNISTLVDDEWMLVNDNEQRLLKRIGSIPVDLTSPMMFRKE